MKKMKVVSVIVVAIALVIGYWAFIGFSQPVPDFTPSDDSDFTPSDDSDSTPSDDSSDPSSDSHYATVTVGYVILPYHGTYSGTQPTETLDFGGISINPVVKQFVSMNEGQVYQRNRLQFTWGGENSGGSGSPYVTLTYYALVSITGPSQYASSWTLPDRQYTNPQTMQISYSFETGRAFFAAHGTYTVTVTFYEYMDGAPRFASTAGVNFEV